MVDASGSTTYCYDRRGNVTRKVQVAGSESTTDYTYTLADRLASITYPSGSLVQYGRDALGRVRSVIHTRTDLSAGAPQTATLVSSVSYLPYGPVNVITYGSGRTLTKRYDLDYAIDSVASNPVGGVSIDFTVNALGNIVGETPTIGGTTPERTYGYDALNRLTDVRDANNALIEQFTYDATGNRLTKKVGAAAAVTYAYPSSSHRLTGVGATARTYDAMGNTTAIGAQTLSYDARGRLSGVPAAGVTYAYNGRGERVAKNAEQFVYDNGGQLLSQGYEYLECVEGAGTESHQDKVSAASHAGERKALAASGVTANEIIEPINPCGAGYEAVVHRVFRNYIWIDNLLVGVFDQPDGAIAKLNYVETDHLGTPRTVVDPSQNAAIWQWNIATTAFGDHAPTGTFSFSMRYPGQYFDAESGLNYNMARDYEAATGRYVESDPLGLKGGLSTYGYVAGKPLIAVDPEGLAIWVCGRAAFGGWLGNHAYIWDDKKKRCCGMNHGHDPLASCNEKGPPTDSCVMIENSDGKEDGIFNCCQKTANGGTWPIRDCHDAANDCITKAGLNNPGAPGGRLGRCDSCWSKPGGNWWNN
jgi:RHS repeat-associated protein